MPDITNRLRQVPGITADWNNWLAQEVANYADEAAAEIDRLRAVNADMRGTLIELRLRLHAAGRRPEECYEMSLIDNVLAEAKP